MSSAEASPPSPERGSEVSNSQWDAFPHKPAADTFSEVQTTVPEVVFRTLRHVQRECPGFKTHLTVQLRRFLLLSTRSD